MFSFINNWAANTGPEQPRLSIMDASSWVGVNLERGVVLKRHVAGSEQLVSCSDNEDNNCEALTDLSSAQWADRCEDMGSILVYWQTWFTHAVCTQRSADSSHVLCKLSTSATWYVWPLYLFFLSELRVIQGVHWCPLYPGSRHISSQ